MTRFTKSNPPMHIRMINAYAVTRNFPHKTLSGCIWYGVRLRAREFVHLKVGDIDGAGTILRVEL